MSNENYAGGPRATPSFETYSDFATYITGRNCSGCNTAFLHSSKDVESLFQSWLNKTPISSQIQCKTCSKSTCIACLGRSGTPVERDVGSFKMSWCCSRGRLFLVWVMLCGFDQVYCDRQRRDASTSGQVSTRSASGGVGYNNSGRSPYTSFFGGRPAVDSQPRERAESAERQIDHFDTAVFSALAMLCPSPHHDKNSGSFDVQPPRAAVSMLVHSKILDRAAELLRNDSLDNATQRKELYMALINFLKRVGVHTVSKDDVIFSERIVLPRNENLLSLSFKGSLPRITERASSLADGLQRLNIQSDMMMRGALNNRREFQDKRGQDMLWRCREISDLSTHLRVEEWFAQQRNRGGPDASNSSVVEVPDKELWPRYHYAQQANMMHTSRPGRIRRLITEITTLKTGFILIIGPQGTPYENGMYEFDLFCGTEFPYKPPQMFYRYPTACQQVINPNLHRHDGKAVCLSLLGTWLSGAKGEDWQPNQSTILQVLISVQAMIFCEEPLGNEPMLLHVGQQAAISKSMNRLVRGHTVKCNLLHYAQHVPVLWKEVVEKHFRANSNTMLEVTERWAKEHYEPLWTARDMHNPLMGATIQGEILEIAPILPSLQAALKKYGATYVPEKIESRNPGQVPGQYGGPYGSRGGFNGPGSGYGAGVNLRFGDGF
ncbi:hypothetical protein NX059_005506 [Plenodomus lindquistii]|nr:hypothetical protein NX059_005506 [Plenodomus lindquistii]